MKVNFAWSVEQSPSCRSKPCPRFPLLFLFSSVPRKSNSMKHGSVVSGEFQSLPFQRKLHERLSAGLMLCRPARCAVSFLSSFLFFVMYIAGRSALREFSFSLLRVRPIRLTERALHSSLADGGSSVSRALAYPCRMSCKVTSFTVPSFGRPLAARLFKFLKCVFSFSRVPLHSLSTHMPPLFFPPCVCFFFFFSRHRG